MLVDEESVVESVVPVALENVVFWRVVRPETESAVVVRLPVSPRSVPVARRKFKLPLRVRKDPERPLSVEVAETKRFVEDAVPVVVLFWKTPPEAATFVTFTFPA
jgi:hypothetical protein